MEDKRKIEIRSDEVQEILSHVPNWMIRWGITLIFILILLGLLLSYIVKYPDVVEGQVVLTTEQPPSRLVSRTNGYINKLYVPNDSTVKKGDLIAEIKSPVNKSAINQIQKALAVSDKDTLLSILGGIEDLGILQTEVNTLYNQLIEYENLIDDNFFENSIQNLTEQIEYNTQLAQISKQELDVLEKELLNAKDKYDADSSLYAKKVIAKHTFYEKKSEYVSKKQLQIGVKKTYVQHKIAASTLKQQKIDLINNFKNQRNSLEANIESAKKTIKSMIESWGQDYTILAPNDGKVSYLTNLTNEQYVESQQPLFAVIPKNEKVIAIVKILDAAFGKIEIGQKVRMKFSNYPYQQFGQLVGSVSEISKVPSEEGYFVKVKLENGLTTTYNKQIDYKPEMSGVAEVVTEDLRLIERIFNNFRKVFDR
ncbi:MAG: HlyD family efflux transporter periplasmic adaptor subunit [Vicingaceae bacterium]